MTIIACCTGLDREGLIYIYNIYILITILKQETDFDKLYIKTRTAYLVVSKTINLVHFAVKKSCLICFVA